MGDVEGLQTLPSLAGLHSPEPVHPSAGEAPEDALKAPAKELPGVVVPGVSGGSWPLPPPQINMFQQILP